MANIFHYTDKEGWNGIRSQPNWIFRARQPKDPDRPVAAYFTDIQPTKANLRALFKRIRIPKIKQEFVFWFVGTDGLEQLDKGLGREKRIYLSRVDYMVAKNRQRHGGATDGLIGKFK
jgi:hypothetical protein